jgi:hypothetical protein
MRAPAWMSPPGTVRRPRGLARPLRRRHWRRGCRPGRHGRGRRPVEVYGEFLGWSREGVWRVGRKGAADVRERPFQRHAGSVIDNDLVPAGAALEVRVAVSNPGARARQRDRSEGGHPDHRHSTRSISYGGFDALSLYVDGLSVDPQVESRHPAAHRRFRELADLGWRGLRRDLLVAGQFKGRDLGQIQCVDDSQRARCGRQPGVVADAEISHGVAGNDRPSGGQRQQEFRRALHTHQSTSPGPQLDSPCYIQACCPLVSICPHEPP